MPLTRSSGHVDSSVDNPAEKSSQKVWNVFVQSLEKNTKIQSFTKKFSFIKKFLQAHRTISWQLCRNLVAKRENFAHRQKMFIELRPFLKIISSQNFTFDTYNAILTTLPKIFCQIYEKKLQSESFKDKIYKILGIKYFRQESHLTTVSKISGQKSNFFWLEFKKWSKKVYRNKFLPKIDPMDTWHAIWTFLPSFVCQRSDKISLKVGKHVINYKFLTKPMFPQNFLWTRSMQIRQLCRIIEAQSLKKSSELFSIEKTLRLFYWTRKNEF